MTTALRSLSRTWWPTALAAAMLIGGYADLWWGGISVAPTLLVLGYCVGIPLAIYRSGRS